MSLGLDFNNATFGKNTPAQAGTDRPKSQFWLNIGYSVTVQGEDGQEQRFVSLAQGIALDNIEAQKTNTNNAVFNQFRAAQNDLAESLINKAKTLKPGEEVIIATGDNGLSIQLRRVKEEAAPIASEDNIFGGFKL